MEEPQESEEGDAVRAKASLNGAGDVGDEGPKESRPRSKKHSHRKHKSADEEGEHGKKKEKKRHRSKEKHADGLDESGQLNGSRHGTSEASVAGEEEDPEKEGDVAATVGGDVGSAAAAEGAETAEGAAGAEGGQLELLGSKSSIFVEDRWAALKEARAFRNENQPRMTIGDGEKVTRSKKYSLFTPSLSDEHPTLADLGPGIAIYFDTLLSLSLLLFTMFILNTPSLVLAFLVTPAQDFFPTNTGDPYQIFKIFTIGGIFRNDTANGGCDHDKCVLRFGQGSATYQMSTLDAIRAISYLDLFSYIYFLFFLSFIWKRAMKIDKNSKSWSFSPSDFTVMVSNLPEDIDEAQIKNHFATRIQTHRADQHANGSTNGFSSHNGNELNGSYNGVQNGFDGSLASTVVDVSEHAKTAEENGEDAAQSRRGEESLKRSKRSSRKRADGSPEPKRSTPSKKKRERKNKIDPYDPSPAAQALNGSNFGSSVEEEDNASSLNFSPEKSMMNRQVLDPLDLTHKTRKKKHGKRMDKDGKEENGAAGEALPRGAEEGLSRSNMTSSVHEDSLLEGHKVEEEGEGKNEDEVVSVVLVRRTNSFLSFLKRRARLLDRETAYHKLILSSSEAKVREKVEMKLQKLREAREEEESRVRRGGFFSGKHAGSAFVIFNSPLAAMSCLEMYSKVDRGMTPCSYPRRLRLQGVRIRVRRALEPSDILWENIEFSSLSRAGRSILVLLLTFLLIVVTFAVVVFAKVAQVNLKGDEQVCLSPQLQSTCNAMLAWDSVSPGCSQQGQCRLADVLLNPSLNLSSSIPLVSSGSLYMLDGQPCRFSQDGSSPLPISQLSSSCLESALLNSSQWSSLLLAGFSRSNFSISHSLPDGPSQCMKCFCTAMMQSVPSLWYAQVGSMVFQIGNDNPCKQQVDSMLRSTSLQTLAIFTVLLLNTLMRTMIVRLAVFVHHTSWSARDSAVTHGTFLGQFFITSLVSLLVYSQITPIYDWMKNKAWIQSHPDFLKYFPLFFGPYPDFSPAWYAAVGVALLLNVAVNIILPLLPILYGLLRRCFLPLLLLQKITQRSLNRHFLEATFELGSRLGILLNVLFVCMLLSSGMPILLLVASLFCLLTYACDKVILLRFSSSPAFYSSSLLKEFFLLMKYAVFLHAAFAVWTYSATSDSGSAALFPRPNVIVSSGVQCNQLDKVACSSSSSCAWDVSAQICLDTGRQALYSFLSRGSNSVTFPHVILAALIALYILLSHTPLRPLAHKLVAYLTCGFTSQSHGVVPLQEDDDPTFVELHAQRKFVCEGGDYDMWSIGNYRRLLQESNYEQVVKELAQR